MGSAISIQMFSGVSSLIAPVREAAPMAKYIGAIRIFLTEGEWLWLRVGACTRCWSSLR